MKSRSIILNPTLKDFGAQRQGWYDKRVIGPIGPKLKLHQGHPGG